MDILFQCVFVQQQQKAYIFCFRYGPTYVIRNYVDVESQEVHILSEHHQGGETMNL